MDLLSGAIVLALLLLPGFITVGMVILFLKAVLPKSPY